MKTSDLKVLATALQSGNPAAINAALSGDTENAMLASIPGGIEMQEAAGQAALVGTLGILPKRCPQEQLEKLGFKFGEDADNLFVNVTFPPGWSKKATDHSMWSDLLDAKGRKRGSIFYKAAFYDRDAFMHPLNCRYVTHQEYIGPANERPTSVAYSVRDAAMGTTLHAVGSRPYADYSGGDELRKQAEAWLKEQYPNADDPLAYWDAPAEKTETPAEPK